MNFSRKKSTSLNIIKKRKIKVLLKDPRNNECFECTNYAPEYISLNNGIFLCENCIINHLNLPKSISNIIKNNLNNLSLNDIQYLCCGGNQKLKNFINTEYPNLKKLSPEYLYQTYAMDYYRRWLEYLIEGGIKPIKPDMDKAYELININISNNNINSINNINNINNMKKRKKNFNKIKSESYMKIFKNKKRYPKIKPIVGSKNSFRFTKSLDRENKLNLTTIDNYNNSYENDDFSNYSNHKILTTDFKKRFFSTQFNKKYDTDDIINDKEDKNNITDINEITEFNEDENNYTENIESIGIRIKNRIKKKNKFDTNIKVLRNNIISPNNTNKKSDININIKNEVYNSNNNNLKNAIYSKPIYQNYLNSFNNNYFLNRNEYRANNTEVKSDLINSIDNLKKYYFSNNKNNNNRYIFNLKQSNHNVNEYQKDENKLNINSINNNIIINKNLNIYYNNNNLKKIFKKKTIGNSFSINDKKQKINNINNYNSSIDNLFKIKNKYKNEWRKKIIENENKENKIKVNRQFNNINNINNVITENKYLKFDNEKEDIIDLKQKSKIIERISRVLKTQKEREMKKSIDKIKVNQNQKNNEDNIKINKDNNKEKNKDITPKVNKNENIETSKSNEITVQRKKNSLSIKELINIPSSKKKNILDLIKSNNLSNQLVSPDSKRLVQIHTDPKKIPKKEKEINSKTSIREMYKRKKNNF